MQRAPIAELDAFLIVAEEQSFTRAAARLGLTPSALSHLMRKLEERIGVRLLNRTTRSVTTTDAGERLLNELAPHYRHIHRVLDDLGELRGEPAGLLRVTCGDFPAEAILLPAAEALMARYPDLMIELSIDTGFTDIAAHRFDAGVRLGETIAQDMIAVKISPDQRMAAVASPDYVAAHGTPETPHDLADHNCINLRFPTHGSLYVWEFEKDGHELNVRVEGQLTVNSNALAHRAALGGSGIAMSLESMFAEDLAAGRLVRLLEDWCPPFPGFYLYYPTNRQRSPTLAALVEELRGAYRQKKPSP